MLKIKPCFNIMLFFRCPFFVGESNISQLGKIFEVLGTPSNEDWPHIAQLPDYVIMREFEGMPLNQIFTAASDNTIRLIEGLLKCNPLNRLTAQQALMCPYFTELPYPTHPSKIPMPHKNERLAS